MATNILTPIASPSYEPIMTSSTNPTSPMAANSNQSATTTGSGTSLRRGNTLKAYLANKNKQKERQAINIIVDPNVLHRDGISEEAAEKNGQDTLTPLSPVRSPLATSPTMSPPPLSGRRIDTDLEALDENKKVIEDQLAVITLQLSRLQPSPNPFSPTTNPEAPFSTLSPSLLPDTTSVQNMSKEELTQKKERLCFELDQLMKQRRELLQSWTRDYKNLKRSGSLAKRQEDLYWVTTA